MGRQLPTAIAVVLRPERGSVRNMSKTDWKLLDFNNWAVLLPFVSVSPSQSMTGEFQTAIS